MAFERQGTVLSETRAASGRADDALTGLIGGLRQRYDALGGDAGFTSGVFSAPNEVTPSELLAVFNAIGALEDTAHKATWDALLSALRKLRG